MKIVEASKTNKLTRSEMAFYIQINGLDVILDYSEECFLCAFSVCNVRKKSFLLRAIRNRK